MAQLTPKSLSLSECDCPKGSALRAIASSFIFRFAPGAFLISNNLESPPNQYFCNHLVTVEVSLLCPSVSLVPAVPLPAHS